METADIVIKNGMVLTMDQNRLFYEKADVVVTGSVITEISPNTKYSGKKEIDASGKLVMPGLVNTHNHAAMTLLRGLADDMPLDIWWQKFIFPIEKKFGSPEFVKVGVALAAIEMIKSGTTTFADMYFHQKESAGVCKDIGIRAFLGEGIFDFETPSNRNADNTFKYIEEFYNEYKNDELISAIVAPHTPYTCSEDVLSRSRLLSDKLNVPLKIHLSETRTENSDSMQNYGMSPTQRLEKMGFLSEKMIAVHCVHLSEDDINILKNHSVKVSHCQESNMKLASGNAPVVEMLNKGIKVGIGTDGAASNNNLDMFDEMDTVAKVHKLILHDPVVLKAEKVVEMATCYGANALLRDDIGSLETGKKADIIILDFRQPHLTPLYNIYSHLVYSAGGQDTTDVIINGKLVMENRKILTVDEDKIIADAIEFSKKIRSQL